MALGFDNGLLAGGVPSLYNDGAGCGARFQVRCKDAALCSQAGTLVVATFCSAIYNGGDLLEALKIAKGFSTPLCSQAGTLVVATSCFAIYNGGDILEALKIAKGFSTPLDVSFHELLEPQNLDSKALVFEINAFVASVYSSLSSDD